MKARGFTLMEMILTLGMVTVVLGLLSMAVDLHLRVAGAGREEVRQGRLARMLLQQIGDDLRAAVPVAQGESEIGGLMGNSQELQVEISRMPLADPSQPIPSDAERSLQFAPRADLRTVTYAVAGLGGLISADASRERVGLLRSECERATYAWAREHGDTVQLDRALKPLAPEVENIEFTYFDRSGTAYTEWSSLDQGGLPSAVRVLIAMRRSAQGARSPSAAEPYTADQLAELSPPVVYDMLVYLPNADATLQRAVAEAAEAPKSTTDKDQSPESGKQQGPPGGSGGTGQ